MSFLKRLSKRDRRALIGLSVFGGGTALLFFVVFPYMEAHQEIKSELETKRQVLARSLETIAMKQNYLEELAGLEAAQDRVERRLLDASNANLAKTQLLNILSDLAADTEVTISRSADVPERGEGVYTRITQQINLEGDITALVGFLRAVAEHEKFLKVEDFNLTIIRSRRSQQTSLRPRLRIYGLLRLS